MKLQFSGPFSRDYERLPAHIKERVNKQVELLSANPSHPSLRLKKMRRPDNIWEARLTQGYRITLQIAGDVAFLRRIGTHDILRNP